MRRILPLVCITIILLLDVGLSFAQIQPTGTPPFNSFQMFPSGSINLGTLGTHLNISARTKAGRGTPFVANWNYDNEVWSMNGSQWQVSPTLGVFFGTPVVAGSPATYTMTTPICNGQTVHQFTSFVYVDVGGTAHAFPSVTLQNPACTSPTSASGTSGDSYQLTASVNGSNVVTTTVTTSDGAVITGSSNSSTGSFTDRNGNQITVSGGTYTDTLGMTVLTTSFGTSSTYTYTGEGGNESITETYTNYYLASAFAAGCSGTTDYVASTQSALPTKFALPDGSNYLLSWEQTPGKTSAYSTGRIASITLPTGGTISFSYNGSNNGMNCDGTTSGMTMTTPDGTWTFAHTTPNASHITTTRVTSPAGDLTAYSFYASPMGPVEIQRQVNTGSSTLLETIVTCYNGQTTNCATAPNSFSSISRVTTYTQIPVDSNGMESETDRFYNTANEFMTEQDDYDFGGSGTNAPPGPLLRKRLISYGSWNGSSCTALGNNIQDLPCQDIIQNGSGVQQALTSYTYDQDISTLVASGATQHTNPSGSRGNVTTIAKWVSGTTYLNQTFTHYDTGLVYTAKDVNNDQTTYTYGACDDGFPTSISLPASLSESMSWNCGGGVEISFTDANSKTASTYFSGQSFWRPSSSTDTAGNTTTYSYSPTTYQRSMNFASSTDTVLTTYDSLGRTKFVQRQQAPGSSTYDSIETDYDNVGRVYRTSEPYSGTAGQSTAGPYSAIYAYDGLNRVTQTQDSTGAIVAFAYAINLYGFNKTISPAPTGEDVKSWNYAFDSLGRLNWVCEGSVSSNGGGCFKVNAGNSGFFAPAGPTTGYTYDALGDLTSVVQDWNTGTQQTRSYAYDGLGRLTSETNPESGTTTYTYDTSSAGDLATKRDANGNTISYSYTAMHRLYDATFGSTACRHFRYDSANGISGAVNLNGRLAYAYTDVCSGSPITKEYFSYDADGRQADLWETTPNSGGQYHVTSQFYANGARNTLLAYQSNGSLITALPTMTYGIDGEGRPTSDTAGWGQNPVTSASYNVAGKLTNIAYGSGDSDSFSYGSTFRMTGYTFTVNGSNDAGTLTWNANGTLQKLAITDALNSAETQTCNYGYDPVMRLKSANCGTPWSQTFSYDDFGNLSKSGSLSFNPGYNYATNRYTSLPGLSYDADGHLLNDSFNTYSWSVFDEPLTVQPDGGGNTISLTHDVVGRVVEMGNGGTYTQVLYSPTGQKLALMNGQNLQKAFVPLPGGATALYTPGALYYRHADWLGSSRVTSTATGTAATPRFVQVNYAIPQTNQSAVSVAFNSAQTAGNLNVIAVGWNDTTSSVTSVTDSNGNVYSLAIGPSRGTNLSQSIYYAANIRGGSNTVTVNFNQPAVSVDLRIMEYSGVSTSSPLDATAVGSGISNGGNVGTSSANTTFANELIVGAGMTSWAFTAAGPGFTSDIITPHDADIAEHQVVSNVGSYNASANLQNVNNTKWLMQMATFKAATTSGTSVYFDGAYAPYGEAYAQMGTTDLSFTGQNQDIAAGLYDFSAREYHGGAQGRWISPDPSGLAAVDPKNPQTWNRYAYVGGNPLAGVDMQGLDFSDAIGCVIGCGGGGVYAAPNFFQNQLDASNRTVDLSFGRWADWNDRQTFGDSYYDLPGHANPIQQALGQYVAMVNLTIDAAKKKPAYLRLESRCALTNSLGQTLYYTLRNTYGAEIDKNDEWDIIEHQSPDTSVANSVYGLGTSFQNGNDFVDDIRVGAGQKPINNTQTFTIGHGPKNPQVDLTIKWGKQMLPSNNIQMSISGVWVNGKGIPDTCERPNQ